MTDEIIGPVGVAKLLEQELLAYCVRNPNAVATLGIVPDDFEADIHRTILGTIQDLVRRDHAATPNALIQHLQDYRPDEPELIRYVGVNLVGEFITADDYVPALLRSIRHRRAARQVSTIFRTGQALLSEAGIDVPEQVARVADQALNAAKRSDDWRSTGSVIASFLAEELQAIQERTPMLIPSGIPSLDRIFGGIAREGVTLVIGESRMGKTTFLNRLAVGLCEQGYHVALHGTETSESERLRDLVYSVARVNQVGARDVHDESHRESLALQVDRAASIVSHWPLEVSGSGVTIEKLISRAQRLRREGKLDVLVVDYVQDFPRSRNDRGMGTTEFIMSVSQSLKDLAAELRIPVVVGAQAGKKTLDEAKKRSRPGMWDAQWASKLPQDAEEVWCLFRHDVYRQEWGDQWNVPGRSNEIEVFRRKSRKSAGDEAFLVFDGPTKWIGDNLGAFRPMGVH